MNKTNTIKNPQTPAFAKAGAAPGTTGGVEPALSRPWPSHCPRSSVFKSVQACRLPALKPSKPSNPPAGLSTATLAATRSKPSRRPFYGNSRSHTPQPSVFKGVQACRLPALKPSKPSKSSKPSTCGAPRWGRDPWKIQWSHRYPGYRTQIAKMKAGGFNPTCCAKRKSSVIQLRDLQK